MGKGTIISGGTDGQYQIQVNYNRVAYDAEIARLTTQISEYTTNISDKQFEIDTLNIEYAAMVTAGYSAEAYAAKKNEISAAEREKASLTIYKLSFEKRKEYLEANMPDDATQSAWCADLTEDLTGVVGTVEVPGESTYVQIQPGYDGNSTYNQTRDGQLIPTVVSTAAQTFYNLAMLPGWQKWKPLFRYATITAIDGDTADITLENIKSSQQSLKINQTDTIQNVAIEYMNCNGSAFEVGDEVLVKFTGQAWETPVIVGFESNPKPCELVFFIKPKFNGDYGTKGNQTIKISYEQNGEAKTQTVTVWGENNTPSPDDPSLYGYSLITIEGGVSGDIELSLKAVGAKNGLLTNATFAMYSTATAEDATDIWSDRDGGFLYAKKIDWKNSTVSTISTTKLTYDGAEYDVWEPEFDGLKILCRQPNIDVAGNSIPAVSGVCEETTITWFKNELEYTNAYYSYFEKAVSLYEDTSPCPPQIIYTFYGTMDESYPLNVTGSQHYCDYYIGCANGVASSLLTRDYEPPYSVGLMCIIADEDGSNPSYSGANASFQSRITAGCQQFDEWWEEYELIWYTEVVKNWAWDYVMIDTPVEAF